MMLRKNWENGTTKAIYIPLGDEVFNYHQPMANI
jgi:hypothetical protein